MNSLSEKKLEPWESNAIGGFDTRKSGVEVCTEEGELDGRHGQKGNQCWGLHWEKGGRTEKRRTEDAAADERARRLGTD